MKVVQWILFAGFACALFLIGCSSAEKKTAAQSDFKQLCAKCHELDRVDAAHKAMTRDQMKKVVERMAQKHDSGINLNSIDDIVEQIY